jgi:hypothetical protein
MSGWRRERGAVSRPLPPTYWVASPCARWLFVVSRAESKRTAGPAFSFPDLRLLSNRDKTAALKSERCATGQ